MIFLFFYDILKLLFIKGLFIDFWFKFVIVKMNLIIKGVKFYGMCRKFWIRL